MLSLVSLLQIKAKTSVPIVARSTYPNHTQFIDRVISSIHNIISVHDFHQLLLLPMLSASSRLDFLRYDSALMGFLPTDCMTSQSCSIYHKMGTSVKKSLIYVDVLQQVFLWIINWLSTILPAARGGQTVGCLVDSSIRFNTSHPDYVDWTEKPSDRFCTQMVRRRKRCSDEMAFAGKHRKNRRNRGFIEINSIIYLYVCGEKDDKSIVKIHHIEINRNRGTISMNTKPSAKLYHSADPHVPEPCLPAGAML